MTFMFLLEPRNNYENYEALPININHNISNVNRTPIKITVTTLLYGL